MRDMSSVASSIASSVERARREWRTRRRALALTHLVKERLPAEYDVRGDVDAWPLVAAGLLSRMTTTMHSLFALQWRQRAADPATLVRSLYEHLVHLAWLAADPSAERLEEWRRSDLRIRVAAAKEAAARGFELMTPSDLQALDAKIAGMLGTGRLSLEALAQEADEHWTGRLPGLSGETTSSLRAMYTVLYRQYSGAAHPSFRGLNAVVIDVSATRKRVVLEAPFEGRGPFGMATVTYAMALFIVSDSLGWPEHSRVTRAFERYPVR